MYLLLTSLKMCSYFHVETPICTAEKEDSVDWPETSENSSAIMPCPGNATGMFYN